MRVNTLLVKKYIFYIQKNFITLVVSCTRVTYRMIPYSWCKLLEWVQDVAISIYCIGMYGGKWRSEAQAEEMAGERIGKTFIKRVTDKCNVQNNCWKLHTSVLIHSWRWNNWRTHSKMPGISCTLSTASSMRAIRFFRCPHKK